MTHSRPAIAGLLDSGGLAPRRDLGQNFVTDPNTVRKIASLADVDDGDHVIEIGAGLGSLTLALAETGAQITALEVDRGIVAVLRDVTAAASNVDVIEADARTVDWPTTLAAAPRWTLVANLPYNIATPLVCDLLDDVHQIQTMLVMVQREVAERFAAQPGAKEYGAVSVKIAYWASANLVGVVPASVFFPRPNVESALVRIERRPTPAIAPELLFGVVKKAFGQRRKMLRKSLGDITTTATFERAGIDPTRRPETLDLPEWVRLTEAIDR